MFHIELRGPKTIGKCICSGCGNEHTFEEEGELFYETKIAYSLKTMCSKVGIRFYKAVWQPNNDRKRVAGGLRSTLKNALVELKRNPVYFKNNAIQTSFNSYNELVTFVEDYMKACELHPKAKIIVYELSKPEV